MTDNTLRAIALILIGCIFIGEGIQLRRSIRKVIPNAPTSRRRSRTEARRWMSSMGVLGLGMVCIGVETLRYNLILSCLGGVFTIIGCFGMLYSFVKLSAVNRTHNNRVREGR